MGASTTTILRFKRSERFLHWAIAIPFLGCLSTALFLLLLDAGDSPDLVRETVSTIHKIFGICLIVFPVIVLVCHNRDLLLHLKNIKEGWLWDADDIMWIVLLPLYKVSKKISLPREGKFNAGEKINFMITMTGYFCFAMTGVLILYGRDLFLSSSIHFFITTLTVPVIAGHIFMATINPQTRKGLTGMLTGFVEREWASHHYRRWFKEEFDTKPKKCETSPAETSPVEPEPTGKTGFTYVKALNILSAVIVGALFASLLYSSTVIYIGWLAPRITL